MKECPECGHIFDMSSASKPWVDFEFTDENLFVFKQILYKSFSYMRFNEFTELDTPLMAQTMDRVRSGIPIPLDLKGSFDAIYMGMNISLCAILEFFHLTKQIPKESVRMKDTNMFKKIEKARHLFAHIISSKDRHGRVLASFNELDIPEVFTDISAELFKFIIEGIEIYLEKGKLSIADFINTQDGRRLIKWVNERRLKANKPIFEL